MTLKHPSIINSYIPKDDDYTGLKLIHANGSSKLFCTSGMLTLVIRSSRNRTTFAYPTEVHERMSDWTKEVKTIPHLKRSFQLTTLNKYGRIHVTYPYTKLRVTIMKDSNEFHLNSTPL